MSDKEPGSYLFNVDILVKDTHHATALQALIAQLNSVDFLDYKILSGIDLGSIIDEHKSKAKKQKNIPIKLKQTESEASNISISDNNHEFEHGLEAFKQFKNKNKLIRLIVNRGLGIKMSIPCRVINVDELDHIITVYHVDEKQVYTFRLNEIEDFIVT